jgi:hypothetical protein
LQSWFIPSGNNVPHCSPKTQKCIGHIFGTTLERRLVQVNDKALDLLGRISAAAWQHLHCLGHFAFRIKSNPIDLEAILPGIDWG